MMLSIVKWTFIFFILKLTFSIVILVIMFPNCELAFYVLAISPGLNKIISSRLVPEWILMDVLQCPNSICTEGYMLLTLISSEFHGYSLAGFLANKELLDLISYIFWMDT